MVEPNVAIRHRARLMVLAKGNVVEANVKIESQGAEPADFVRMIIDAK